MSQRSYVESIYYFLKDQEVEIYSGDFGETHQFSETQKQQKNLIRGVIKAAEGDCLIILVKKDNKYATVYLNGYNIKSIVKISDPLYIMDIYNDEAFGKK